MIQPESMAAQTGFDFDVGIRISKRPQPRVALRAVAFGFIHLVFDRVILLGLSQNLSQFPIVKPHAFAIVAGLDLNLGAFDVESLKMFVVTLWAT